MTTASALYDSLIQVPPQIYNEIEARHFVDARELAKGLYHKGKTLLVTNGDALEGHRLIPILADFNKIYSDHLVAIQGESALLHTFSKTYRIFIELTACYQWKSRTKPVLQETLDGIHEHANRGKSVIEIGFTRDPRTGEMITGVDTRFALRCAQHGAKFFKPSRAAWQRYLEPFMALAEAAEGQSVVASVRALITIGEECRKDWIPNWYATTLGFRWLATQEITQEDFIALIEPKIATYQEKGGNYFVCLIVVLMDIIKNPNATHDTKQNAFSYLLSLFKAKPEELRVSEVVRKICRRPDSLFEGRLLAIQYLVSLATKEKYRDFHEPAQRYLRERNGELQAKRSGRQLNLDRGELTKALQKLEICLKQKEHLEDQKAALLVQARGSIAEEIEPIEASLQKTKEEETILYDACVQFVEDEEENHLATVLSMFS